MPTNIADIETIDRVLHFWFSELTPEQWWRSTELDNIIRARFLETYTSLSQCIPQQWTKTSRGCLAAIIVLDQFPRNIFRNTAQSFATDAIALKVAKDAIAREMDKDLNADEKVFLYMPLQHSENAEDQKFSVALFKSIGDQNSYEFALKHKEIIDRFGRFPHRNELLGRSSTGEEISFLAEGALFW